MSDKIMFERINALADQFQTPMRFDGGRSDGKEWDGKIPLDNALGLAVLIGSERAIDLMVQIINEASRRTEADAAAGDEAAAKAMLVAEKLRSIAPIIQQTVRQCIETDRGNGTRQPLPAWVPLQ